MASYEGQGVLVENAALANQILPFSCIAQSNTLVATLKACFLAFRSTTLTTGIPTAVKNTGDLTLTVPAGATLGTVNNVQARIAFLALNYNGVMELAVVNLAGGNQLDEANLISTTAISGSSNSANVIYSANARSNVAYRVVGFIDITEATAGTWATAPTLVQGGGGEALAALSSIGYGQTWQNVTGSRSGGTTYYNTTGKPIVVAARSSNSGAYLAYVNSVQVAYGYANSYAHYSISFVVPPGASYQCASPFTTDFWSELR